MEYGHRVTGANSRTRSFFLVSILSVLVLLSAAVPAAAAPPGPVDVIITFRAAPGAADEALVRGFGGTVRGKYTIVPAIAASLPAGAVEALQRNPRVALIEPDIEVQAADLGDSDPEVAAAWGVDRLDANIVWSATAASGIGVAIVDTGSGPHTDLPAAVARLNCLSGTCVSGSGNDDNGHGTHVAGTVLATRGNGGVVGMAPSASLFSYKVLDKKGSGSYSGIIGAVDHIVNYNAGNPAVKIQVANLSLGSSTNPGSAVKTAFDNAYNSGLLVIAAAGNSGNRGGKNDSVIYPARYESVVAVAATDKSDTRASFSSTGPAVELAAPGVSIKSTWLANGYNTISGTSMATPHVTGAAALVIGSGVVSDANGSNGIADEVRARLDGSVKDLGAIARDNLYGYGLVNPPAAAGVDDLNF